MVMCGVMLLIVIAYSSKKEEKRPVQHSTLTVREVSTTRKTDRRKTYESKGSTLRLLFTTKLEAAKPTLKTTPEKKNDYTLFATLQSHLHFVLAHSAFQS